MGARRSAGRSGSGGSLRCSEVGWREHEEGHESGEGREAGWATGGGGRRQRCEVERMDKEQRRKKRKERGKEKVRIKKENKKKRM